MKNESNRRKYRLLSAIYDQLMGNRWFVQARKRAFSLLPFAKGQEVLLVGVGTGQDLPLLPDGLQVTGIDLSEDMLERAREKAGRHTVLRRMNAEQLDFADRSFAFVILNLVLSVVEQPQQALREAVRVLKPGGTILVFDKFLHDGEKPAAGRRLLNVLTAAAGTDINRRFRDISNGVEVHVTHEEASIMGGAYKILLLRRE
ncbi:methyltransferase domain-containing protein [Ectobacillus ponti]|uniref:Methyltransferase domain-containing protein n=1 Tax=Ectobacillus ponti TaxID=2961894 RepID=A0AA41XA82_9BACI|nr:methyltransferase domain-containing protein [Ectobacillus ponti]MCP8970023.1 methyltransferase domain-containing protein [Ectobacillus ponti]